MYLYISPLTCFQKYTQRLQKACCRTKLFLSHTWRLLMLHVLQFSFCAKQEFLTISKHTSRTSIWKILLWSQATFYKMAKGRQKDNLREFWNSIQLLEESLWEREIRECWSLLKTLKEVISSISLSRLSTSSIAIKYLLSDLFKFIGSSIGCSLHRVLYPEHGYSLSVGWHLQKSSFIFTDMSCLGHPNATLACPNETHPHLSYLPWILLFDTGT